MAGARNTGVRPTPVPGHTSHHDPQENGTCTLQTEHAIVTPQPPGPPRAPPHVPLAFDPAEVRDECFRLLADLPAFERKSILAQVNQMRRADDSWRLRDALFEAIAHTHGDNVARARLATLDARFQ